MIKNFEIELADQVARKCVITSYKIVAFSAFLWIVKSLWSASVWNRWIGDGCDRSQKHPWCCIFSKPTSGWAQSEQSGSIEIYDPVFTFFQWTSYSLFLEAIRSTNCCLFKIVPGWCAVKAGRPYGLQSTDQSALHKLIFVRLSGRLCRR